MKSSPHFWRWSLSMSDSQWCELGHVLIQIFGHSILSKCTSSNTATPVSCETKKILDAWLFTGGTPSYLPRSSWEASRWLVSVFGLRDSVWVASLKPPPAKIALSTGICNMSGKDVSFVYFRIWYGFPFSRHGDDPIFSHSSHWLGTFFHLFLVPCLIEVS